MHPSSQALFQVKGLRLGQVASPRSNASRQNESAHVDGGRRVMLLRSVLVLFWWFAFVNL